MVKQIHKPKASLSKQLELFQISEKKHTRPRQQLATLDYLAEIRAKRQDSQPPARY